MGPSGNAPTSIGNASLGESGYHSSLRKGPAKNSRKFTANERVRSDRPSYAEPDDYFSPPKKAQRSTTYASPLLFTDEEEEELRRADNQRSPLTRENLQSLQAEYEADSAGTDPRFEDPAFIAFMRKSKSRSPEKKKFERKKTKDIGEHPLNLPPDELKRLSARMAKDEKRSSAHMDVDVDSESVQPDVDSQKSQPPTPGTNPPGAFPSSEPLPNGNENANIREQTKSPTPPPHRINTQPKMDPEAAKAAGNKFFKAKDYGRAVVEYSKGA